WGHIHLFGFRPRTGHGISPPPVAARRCCRDLREPYSARTILSARGEESASRLRAARQPPGRLPGAAHPSDATILAKESLLKLSFADSKAAPKYKYVTAFVRDKLPKLKQEGTILKAFFDKVGAPAASLQSALTWGAAPTLQIMPLAETDEIVPYVGKSQLIL